MSGRPALLYCHCAYAKVIPNEVKSAVLRGLSEAGVEFDAGPDLCAMAARRDPRLQELAKGEPLRVAACYSRAVRWLFAAAGGDLPQSARVWNMRLEPAQEVVSGMLGSDASEPGPSAETTTV
ncbi:MAG: hypothetical protein FJW27_07050 [Acidimicrobiia bacterium]|nr:hypothetical protein [Acidimicrobiia bacterium]